MIASVEFNEDRERSHRPGRVRACASLRLVLLPTPRFARTPRSRPCPRRRTGGSTCASSTSTRQHGCFHVATWRTREPDHDRSRQIHNRSRPTTTDPQQITTRAREWITRRTHSRVDRAMRSLERRAAHSPPSFVSRSGACEGCAARRPQPLSPLRTAQRRWRTTALAPHHLAELRPPLHLERGPTRRMYDSRRFATKAQPPLRAGAEQLPLLASLGPGVVAWSRLKARPRPPP